MNLDEQVIRAYVHTSVGQINGKVIQIELNYSDQSNLIRIKINVFLKVIRIELN